MQKVITITTSTSDKEKEAKVIETEYPTLDKYLQEGYKVVQIVPITTNLPRYSLTFVLEK